MAKTQAPLLSSTAKGRIGKLIVYYGKGYARGWSEQVDPQTAPQMISRAVVGAVMGMVKLSDGLDRAWLRENFSKSWHIKFTAWLSRNGLANAEALHAEWSTWSEQDRDNWEQIAP